MPRDLDSDSDILGQAGLKAQAWACENAEPSSLSGLGLSLGGLEPRPGFKADGQKTGHMEP